MTNYVDFRYVLYSIEEHKKVADGCSKYTKELSDIIHNQLIEVVKAIPVADVVPVRHGKWLNKTIRGDRRTVCSVCLLETGTCYEENYCPNCGAKMDG